MDNCVAMVCIGVWRKACCDYRAAAFALGAMNTSNCIPERNSNTWAWLASLPSMRRNTASSVFIRVVAPREPRATWTGSSRALLAQDWNAGEV